MDLIRHGDPGKTTGFPGCVTDVVFVGGRWVYRQSRGSERFWIKLPVSQRYARASSRAIEDDRDSFGSMEAHGDGSCGGEPIRVASRDAEPCRAVSCVGAVRTLFCLGLADSRSVISGRMMYGRNGPRSSYCWVTWMFPGNLGAAGSGKLPPSPTTAARMAATAAP